MRATLEHSLVSRSSRKRRRNAGQEAVASARAASARTRARDGVQQRIAALQLSPRTTKEPWSGAPVRSSSRSASTIPRSLSHAQISMGALEFLAGAPGGRENAGAEPRARPTGRAPRARRARLPTPRPGCPSPPVVRAREPLRRGRARAMYRARLRHSWRLYLLAYRARAELDQARWREAADSAALVLHERCVSTTPRIFAFVVLGLVRARCGDQEVSAAA